VSAALLCFLVSGSLVTALVTVWVAVLSIVSSSLVCLFVLNPICWSNWAEQLPTVIFKKPIDAKSSDVWVIGRIVVLNQTVERYTFVPSKIFRLGRSKIEGKTIVATMPSSVGRDNKLSKWGGSGIIRSLVGQGKVESFGFHAQSGDESRTSSSVDGGPFDGFIRSRFVWFDNPVRLNHYPWPFQTNLLPNRQPLATSENGIDRTDNKQSDINQHRWRIPGFLIGAALFVSGFILLGYSAKCFEDFNLKLQGLLWLIAGGFLYVVGGSLMFVGPFLL